MNSEVSSELNPIYSQLEVARVQTDVVGQVIKNIINTQKLNFKDTDLLCSLHKSKKSVFSKSEIEFVIEQWPLIIDLVKSEKGMKIFLGFSSKRDWICTEISRQSKASRKAVYEWKAKFETAKLLVKSDKQAMANMEFYTLDWEMFPRVIFILREYCKEILLSKV